MFAYPLLGAVLAAVDVVVALAVVGVVVCGSERACDRVFWRRERIGRSDTPNRQRGSAFEEMFIPGHIRYLTCR